jgi:hypothetical protein
MSECNKFSICILSDILKSLEINKPLDYAGYLYQTNHYGYFSKMCKNSLKNCQYGGNRKNIKFEGIDFNFTKYRDDDYVMYGIFEKDENGEEDKKNGELECLLIRISKKEKTATILGIGYKPCCFTNKQIKYFKGKKNGTVLLKLALKLIDEVKEHYGLTKILLQDNSRKSCNNSYIELSKMSILMYGETWYGKYGFVPSKDEVIDEIGVKQYKKNKKIMDEIKVSDVKILKKYILDGYVDVIKKNPNKNLDLMLPDRYKITELYNTYKHDKRLLKDFIKDLLIDYDKSCLLFFSFYDSLYDDLNLTNFQGKTFVKYI